MSFKITTSLFQWPEILTNYNWTKTNSTLSFVSSTDPRKISNVRWVCDTASLRNNANLLTPRVTWSLANLGRRVGLLIGILKKSRIRWNCGGPDLEWRPLVSRKKPTTDLVRLAAELRAHLSVVLTLHVKLVKEFKWLFYTYASPSDTLLIDWTHLTASAHSTGGPWFTALRLP